MEDFLTEWLMTDMTKMMGQLERGAIQSLAAEKQEKQGDDSDRGQSGCPPVTLVVPLLLVRCG